MAEFIGAILAETVLTQAVQGISNLLIQRAVSLKGLRKEIQSLGNELTRIKCFLEDVDSTKEQDKRMQNWVAEVRDIACEIEDTIETYNYKLNYASYIKAKFYRRKLSAQISLIKDKLSSIQESRRTYQIEFRSGGGTASSLRHSRRSTPNNQEGEEYDLIGFKDTMTSLKFQLMEENDQLRVISIVGMAGLGKTTLTIKVYNDSEVKQHYDCYAWVSMSRKYVLRDVLSEILIQVGFFLESQKEKLDKNKLKTESLDAWLKEREFLKGLEEDELIHLIKDGLQERRYLVVLDNIWRGEDWNSIKSAFPNGKGGSKVVFTTRIKEVASYANPDGLPIEPPFLSIEDSWELLQQKAFSKDAAGQHGCTPRHKELGEEMVKELGGLPLAIVVLGSLLRTKTLTQWEVVKRDVKSYLNKHRLGNYEVEDMFALSYHDLPRYLKPCFLYLCSFPKDHLEISRRKLIRLWIAEGLITVPARSSLTTKEIAEEYMRELVDRCMIQVGKRDYSKSGIKTYRMHDLMRDFCVAKAREENFSEIIQRCQEKQTTTSSFPIDPHLFSTHARRIAVHCDNLDTDQMHPHLRSLLCFGISSTSLVDCIRSNNLKFLRVLEVEFTGDTEECNVPTEIGDFTHLRYIGMKDAKKIKLPSSIGNLLILGTINLRDNKEVVLPMEILRLTHLRHLLLPFATPIPHRFTWKSSVCSNSNPTHIQILKYVRFCPLLLRKKAAEATLKNLQDLGVQFKSEVEVKRILQNPNFELSKLRSLYMSLLSSEQFPSLRPLSQCSVLNSLTLDGKIANSADSCPDSLNSLPKSLTKLVLQNSCSEKDPMEELEKLPSLKFLRLDNAYGGSEIVCGSQGFPKLETLQLFSLENVEEWQVHENAMPNLKSLHIKKVPKLKMIPEGLKDITSFVELKISGMPSWFEDRFRDKDGPDFDKVRGVRSISFSWTVPSQ